MIYLDQAATTYQKPPEVYRAVLSAMHETAGYARGGYRAAVRAGEIVYDCREQIAAFYGISDPARVVFTQNATHALNLAIHALVRPGMRVAVSGFEHNAVMRPLMQRGIRPEILPGALWDSETLLKSVRRAVESGAELFIMTHVSNVFGMPLPVSEVAEILDGAHIPLIVDDAQGAGVLPLEAGRHPCMAAVCLPGHKGLYGPMGTGVLLALDDRLARDPLLSGGTGSLSERLTQPDFLPDALESGTPNVPGIAGLLEGVRYVRREGVMRIAEHERRLVREMVRALDCCEGVRCFTGEGQTGVLSVQVKAMASETIAQRLAAREICTRAGLHCAPLAHRTAGTEKAGTVRFSVSAFTAEEEVEAAAQTLKEVVKNL